MESIVLSKRQIIQNNLTKEISNPLEIKAGLNYFHGSKKNREEFVQSDNDKLIHHTTT